MKNNTCSGSVILNSTRVF